MIIWILTSAEARPTKKSELPIMYSVYTKHLSRYKYMYIYIYIYLFSKPGKPWKRGYIWTLFLSWHHLTELRTIWANLQKTGELDSGISGRLTVSTQIYCQTGWGMWGPCLATKQKTDPLDGPTAPLSKWSNFLCHNWRCIEAPQAFCPSPWDIVGCSLTNKSDAWRFLQTKSNEICDYQVVIATGWCGKTPQYML